MEECVVKTFIIKYHLIMHYFDSAKYKRFIDIKPSYCYDLSEYKKIGINEAIDSFGYFVLEIDNLKELGFNEFYEFRVLFSSNIDVLVEELTTSILKQKPKHVNLREFVNLIDKKMFENKCNWNVYASDTNESLLN
jgi:hypothetical protein